MGWKKWPSRWPFYAAWWTGISKRKSGKPSSGRPLPDAPLREQCLEIDRQAGGTIVNLTVASIKVAKTRVLGTSYTRGMKPVRTALVGCGKVGGLHAAALTTLPVSTLVAVCDSSLERAERFAGRYGGRAFQDVERMIRESGAEAIFV